MNTEPPEAVNRYIVACLSMRAAVEVDLMSHKVVNREIGGVARPELVASLSLVDPLRLLQRSPVETHQLRQVEVVLLVVSRQHINSGESSEPDRESLPHTKLVGSEGLDRHCSPKVGKVFDESRALVEVWDTRSVYHSVSDGELLDCDHLQSGPRSRRLSEHVVLLPIDLPVLGLTLLPSILVRLEQHGIQEARLA